MAAESDPVGRPSGNHPRNHNSNHHGSGHPGNRVAALAPDGCPAGENDRGLVSKVPDGHTF